MDNDAGDRRVEERRKSVQPSENGDGVLRPVTSDSAAEYARRLLELGAPGIEERPDGRLWATGPDRRNGDRRQD
jgi:hypothetical protein